MQITQIKYFLALAEHGHFTRAADAAHVSQPSLTKAIKRLEEEFGFPLFERNGSVKLSELGTVLEPYLVEIQSTLSAAFRQAEDYTANRSARLRLGVSQGVYPESVMTWLAKLKRSAGERISFTQNTVGGLLQDMRNRKIDAALMVNFNEPGPFSIRKVTDDPYMIAMSDNHPLITKDAIDINDLKNQTLYIKPGCRMANELRQQAHGTIQFEEFKLSRIWLYEMLKSEKSIALLPASIPKPKDVHKKPLQGTALERHIDLVTMKDGRKPRLLERLLEVSIQ